MLSQGLVGPNFVYWDGWPFCEVLDVSLVICWLLWFVSLYDPMNASIQLGFPRKNGQRTTGQ